MKSLIALSITLVLVGCATTPRIDPQCDRVGQYARAVATLRTVGVSRYDIHDYTAAPMVVTFPIQAIQQEVYDIDFQTPADAYKIFYDMCIRVGYSNVLQAIKEEREMREEPIPFP